MVYVSGSKVLKVDKQIQRYMLMMQYRNTIEQFTFKRESCIYLVQIICC